MLIFLDFTNRLLLYRPNLSGVMEVISRLFNHRPAIQGELLYFINTFDKKLA